MPELLRTCGSSVSSSVASRPSVAWAVRDSSAACFGAVGVGLLLTAIVVACSTSAFLRDAVERPGVVVDWTATSPSSSSSIPTARRAVGA